SHVTPHYLTRLADITDGASQTILVTECAGRPTLWRAGRAVPGTDVLPGGGAWDGGALIIGLGSTPDGATKPAPRAINCTNQQEASRSRRGGATAGIADASVRFLKASLEMRMSARLVTRAGGEVGPDP